MKLSDIRKTHKLTQAEVASSLGVLQSSISNWENGASAPRYNKIQELAKLYNVTEGDIISAIAEAKAG